MKHRGSVVAGSGLALIVGITLLAIGPIGPAAWVGGDVADAGTAVAPTPASSELVAREGIAVTVDSSRWENGYGERFYQVVGHIKNSTTKPVAAVRVRVELLGDDGKVVKSVDAWNGRAEHLAEATGAAAASALAAKPVTPIAAGASDPYRSTFLADETPPFARQRVSVVEVLPAS